MHWSHYKSNFAALVGKENVGWIVKDKDGKVCEVDPDNNFCEISAVSPRDIIGATTADFAWSGVAPRVQAADILARHGEVRETIGIYWHPVDNMYRRVLGAKWSNDGGQVVFVVADVTRPVMTERMKVLESVITVDWDKEKVTIAENTITRLDLVCLAYYLAHDTHQQIADKMNRSKKSIEKTIGKMRDILCALDAECPTLRSVCQKYGVDNTLAEKVDWFDREAVIWLTSHSQFSMGKKQ